MHIYINIYVYIQYTCVVHMYICTYTYMWQYHTYQKLKLFCKRVKYIDIYVYMYIDTYMYIYGPVQVWQHRALLQKHRALLQKYRVFLAKI